MRASVWMRVATCLVAGIGILAGVGPVAGRARAEDAPPTAKPQPEAEPPVDDRTDVVLTTDAPIVRGRNLLWCATGQLAWDALADLVGTDGRLDLEGA